MAPQDWGRWTRNGVAMEKAKLAFLILYQRTRGNKRVDCILLY